MKYTATITLEDKTLFLDLLDGVMGQLNEGVKGKLKLNKNGEELLWKFSNDLSLEEAEKMIKKSGDDVIERANKIKRLRKIGERSNK